MPKFTVKGSVTELPSSTLGAYILGLYIVNLNDMISIMINMDRYSIHINNTFSLVLDHKMLYISTRFMGFCEYYWPKYPKFKQNVSFEESFN